MIGVALFLGLLGLFTSLAQWKVNRDDQYFANQDAMDFNAKEAEKSREWQEEQYKKYESVAAQMQQRQQAGLNPYENLTSMSVGSGATASTSANQISPLSLPDMSLFGQLYKDLESAEALGIENDFNRSNMEKRKEKFEAELADLNLSNQQKEFWNKMYEQAYFHEDGTPNADLNPFKNDAIIKKNQKLISEYDEKIAHNTKVQNEWRQFLRECLNFEYDALPQHLQEQVTIHLWRVFARQGSNDGALTEQEAFTTIQLKEQISEWIENEQTRNRHDSEGTSSWFRDFEYVVKFLGNNVDTTTEAFAKFIESQIVEYDLKL